MRTRRCFGGPTGGPEELGHTLAMPPTDSEANGTDRDVLTSLPRTRPARRSAKRDRPARAGGGASTASGSSPAKPKAASSGAKPKAASSRAKGASTSRSRTAAATAAKPRAAARPTAATAKAARGAAEPAVPPAGYATEAQAHGHGPDPFAVVTTAVQAAGEIAHIGATLWGQAMRSAISRLPRP